MGLRFSPQTRRRIYVRDGGVCWRCGGTVDAEVFDLDHVIPQAHGGKHDDGNLAVAHPSCNRSAGARMHTIVMPSARVSRW